MLNNVAVMPARPPYVEFEQRSEEDRQETIKQGHYVAKDVDYAIIRAIGAKDAVEKPALDWLHYIEQQARRGRYNPEWVSFFRRQYQEWKAGHDMSVNGTHVKNWAAISPAQRDMLIAARLYTVEDVAGATEEALQRVGMGARALKQRAQAWLDSARQNGSAEELAMLRDHARNQEEKIKALEDANSELRDQVQALMHRLEALGAEGEGDDETTQAARGRGRRAASR